MEAVQHEQMIKKMQILLAKTRAILTAMKGLTQEMEVVKKALMDQVVATGSVVTSVIGGSFAIKGI